MRCSEGAVPDVLMRSSEGAVPHKMECPAEEKDGSKAGSATDMWAWERVELRFSGEDRTLSPFTTFIPKWNESAGKDCGSLVGSEFVPAVRLTTPDVPIWMGTVILDPQIRLSGPTSIVGRSIVIHYAVDGGRWVCADIVAKGGAAAPAPREYAPARAETAKLALDRMQKELAAAQKAAAVDAKELETLKRALAAERKEAEEQRAAAAEATRLSSCHISRAPQRCKACRLLLATAASHPHCSAHYERAHVRSRLY